MRTNFSSGILNSEYAVSTSGAHCTRNEIHQVPVLATNFIVCGALFFITKWTGPKVSEMRAALFGPIDWVQKVPVGPSGPPP
jgi:hypothetical protein